MKLDTIAFRAWCVAKSIQTCLDIQQDAFGSRYTVLSDATTAPASLMSVNNRHHINLLQVPLQACLTAKSSEQLADKLLLEKQRRTASDFGPYLDLIPDGRYRPGDLLLASLPRFWSDDRLRSVTDGGFLEQSLQRDRLRYDHYYRDYQHDDQLDGATTEEDYAWALAIVDSRSHFLPDGRYSLTPVLDMINHDPTVMETTLRVVVQDSSIDGADSSSSNSCSNEPEKIDNNLALCLDIHKNSLPKAKSRMVKRTLSTIQPGEVCISYGDFSNIHTLLNYGFVSPNNPNNEEGLLIRTIGGNKPITLTVPASGNVIGKITNDTGLAQLGRTLGIGSTMSKGDEEELFGLVVGELQVAADQAAQGVASNAADTIVASYLEERRKTLEAALKKFQADYPQLF